MSNHVSGALGCPRSHPALLAVAYSSLLCNYELARDLLASSEVSLVMVGVQHALVVFAEESMLLLRV
jgi:hypothetical protein